MILLKHKWRSIENRYGDLIGDQGIDMSYSFIFQEIVISKHLDSIWMEIE